MNGIVKLIGIMILAAGVVYFVKPLAMKKVLSYFLKETRIKLGGAVSIIIGLFFLRAAGACTLPWLVVVFGLLSVVKGFVALAMGINKFPKLLAWLNGAPAEKLRRLSLVSIVVGVALIYAA